MPKNKVPSPHENDFHGDIRKGAYLRRQAAYQIESAMRDTESSQGTPRKAFTRRAMKSD